MVKDLARSTNWKISRVETKDFKDCNSQFSTLVLKDSRFNGYLPLLIGVCQFGDYAYEIVLTYLLPCLTRQTWSLEKPNRVAIKYGELFAMEDETTRKRLPDRGETESEPYCRILDIDIEADCIMTEQKCCSLEYGMTLLKHDEAPEFLRGNPFVVHGYRPTLPFTLCIWRY